MNDEFDNASEALVSIDELAKKLCREPWELAALCVQNSWASGLRMTENAFKKAQNKFWSEAL